MADLRLRPRARQPAARPVRLSGVSRSPAVLIAASVAVSLLAACTPTAKSGASDRPAGSTRRAQP